MNNADLFRSIIQEELVVGNNESVLMFANSLQYDCKSILNEIANISVSTFSDIEQIIEEIKHSIIKMSDCKVKKHKNPKYSQSKVIQTYNDILVYIDKLSVVLKMEEADLIKSVKTLNLLATQIDDLIQQISDKIKYANQVIKSIEFDIKDENIINWKLRLEQRVNNLGLTKTILNQNKSQIRLIIANNDNIVDKINNTLNNIMPLWKEQTNLLIISQRKKQEQELWGIIDFIKSRIGYKHDKITISEKEEMKKQNKMLIETLDELNYVHKEKMRIVNNLMV